MVGAGGTVGVGGRSGTGGITGSGGILGTGGVIGTGGMFASGGSQGSGGTPGTGGASLPPGPDAGADAPTAVTCTIYSGDPGGTKYPGSPPPANTTGPFCIVTCDDIGGWGCANTVGRQITVNGQLVGSGSNCGGTLVKKNGYYVFQVSAGSASYASIYWWVNTTDGWVASCPIPDGGFAY